MKKIIIAILLISMQFFLQSCPKPNDIDPIITPHPSVVKLVNFLNSTPKYATQYDLDEDGFPFHKGEFVVEFNNSYGKIDQIRKDSTSLKNALVVYLKSALNKPSITNNEVEVIKCECNDFIFLFKLKFPINNDEQKAVLKGHSGDWIEDIEPNYISYQDVENRVNVIDYHDVTNPYAVANQNNPVVTQNAGRTPNPNFPSILVGLLDTGIDENDPLIYNTSSSNNCYADDYIGYNLVNTVVGNDNLPSPNRNAYDDAGHGSHIAENIRAITGLNGPKNTFFVPVKTHDKYGIGSLFSVSCGVRYAANIGVKIINASWGIVHNDSTELSILRNAIHYAATKNVLFITSGGNDGEKLIRGGDFQTYPAMFENVPNMIVVGAVDRCDTKYITATYANFGEDYVDLLAQGTTSRRIGNDNTIYWARGTSFSVGIVTGVATDIYYQNNQISYQEAKTKLLDVYSVTNTIANDRAKNSKILNQNIGWFKYGCP